MLMRSMRLLDQYQGCPFNKGGGGSSVSYNKHFGGKLIGNVENFVFTNIFKKHSSTINVITFRFPKRMGILS